MTSEQTEEGVKVLAAAVQVLGDRTHGLVDTVEVLAKDANALLESRKRDLWIWRAVGILGVVILVTLSIVTVLLVQSRSRGITNQTIYRDQTALLEQLQSCYEPGSVCYDAQSKATAELTVSSIYLGSQCIAENPNSREAAIKCIEDRTGIVIPTK